MNEFIESLKAETNNEPNNVEEIDRVKLIEEVMRKREEEVWEK